MRLSHSLGVLFVSCTVWERLRRLELLLLRPFRCFDDDSFFLESFLGTSDRPLRRIRGDRFGEAPGDPFPEE